MAAFLRVLNSNQLLSFVYRRNDISYLRVQSFLMPLFDPDP
jgi:hypothetical protein